MVPTPVTAAPPLITVALLTSTSAENNFFFATCSLSAPMTPLQGGFLDHPYVK